MSATAEIIVVGNEVLQGDVLDTNSHWLCVQLAGLGAMMQQVVQIRDDPAAIAEALHQALRRESELVVFCGGLGPTDDDLTVASVAQALGLALLPNKQALAMVAATYQRLAKADLVASSEMTPARAKMANLPPGAQPLANSVGSAPGVLLAQAQSTIICLPGVPQELKAIWNESLPEHLARILGPGRFGEWQAMVRCGDESILAPILRPVAQTHYLVYVKSRAKPFGPDQRFRITLSAQGQDVDEITKLVEQAWDDLRQRLTQANIEILSFEPVR